MIIGKYYYFGHAIPLMPKMNLKGKSQLDVMKLINKRELIPQGDYVKVIGKGQKRGVTWYNVTWRGKRGWINSIAIKDVKESKPTSDKRPS